MTSKRIITRSNFSFPLLFIVSFLFVFLALSWRNPSSSVSKDVSWSEKTGIGISVPACGSSGINATCSGDNPVVTFSWNVTGGTCTRYQNIGIWKMPPGYGLFDPGYSWLIVYAISNGVVQSGATGSCVSGTYTWTGALNDTTYYWGVGGADDITGYYHDVGSGSLSTPNCSPLAVSCSVSPTTADIGQSVTWSAIASGGRNSPGCTSANNKAECTINEAASPPSVTIIWGNLTQNARNSLNTSYVCIWDPLTQTFAQSDCWGTNGGNQSWLSGSNAFSDINGVSLQSGRSYNYRVYGCIAPTPGGDGCAQDSLGDYGDFTISYVYLWSGTDGLSGTTRTVSKSYSTAGTKTGSITVTAGRQSVTNTCTNSTTVLQAQETLSVSKSGTGSGTVTSSPAGISCGSTCSTSYDYGTSVTLTTAPSAGSTFTGWSGACSGAGSCVVSMTAAKSVTATFALGNYTLTTSISSGSGTITSSGISCPGDCSESYAYGTWVSLIATPATDYTFDSWTGSCVGQTGICSILIDSDKTVGVNFTYVAPFNYSLLNSGTSYVIKTNNDAFTQNTINKTLTTGTTQSVTLAVSGLPSGASVDSISSQGCSPTCQSTITFRVSSSAPIGTFPITVAGSSLNKQTNFNLVISGSPMTVSCSSSPGTALVGQTVTWTANVSGGTPPLSYSWSGTNIPINPAPNTNPFSISYSTIGQKVTTVTVTDTDSVQATCPASIQINFNPLFEEF